MGGAAGGCRGDGGDGGVDDGGQATVAGEELQQFAVVEDAGAGGEVLGAAVADVLPEGVPAVDAQAGANGFLLFFGQAGIGGEQLVGVALAAPAAGVELGPPGAGSSGGGFRAGVAAAGGGLKGLGDALRGVVGADFVEVPDGAPGEAAGAEVALVLFAFPLGGVGEFICADEAAGEEFAGVGAGVVVARVGVGGEVEVVGFVGAGAGLQQEVDGFLAVAEGGVVEGGAHQGAGGGVDIDAATGDDVSDEGGVVGVGGGGQGQGVAVLACQLLAFVAVVGVAAFLAVGKVEGFCPAFFGVGALHGVLLLGDEGAVAQRQQGDSQGHQ